MHHESLILKMMLDGSPSTYRLGPLATLELDQFIPVSPPVYIIDKLVAQKHPGCVEQIQNSCFPGSQKTLLVEGGEKFKTLSELEKIYQWLCEQSLTRDGTIVAMGGGTVLDLVGLAASTWRRGVNFVSIPTTLLAMVDASIGGKTALNAAGLKNPVGTFHPASGVLADVGYLATLTCADWRNGLAELIKTAAIGDAELFSDLYSARDDLKQLLANNEAHLPIQGILGALPWLSWIGRAATVKSDLVNRDFRESGPRKALNLGHTLGHALEAYSQHSGPALSHGQAVSIGMAVIFRIAADRKVCPVPDTLEMIQLLEACGLPVTWPAPPVEILEKLLAGDKKLSAQSGLSWVLPERIGKTKVDAKIEAAELLPWLEATL